jgi:hypothetical protein
MKDVKSGSLYVNDMCNLSVYVYLIAFSKYKYVKIHTDDPQWSYPWGKKIGNSDIYL